MSIRTFIRANRQEIDRIIRERQPKGFGGQARYNDEERRQWILNDEGLYNWARSCGVPV